MEYEKNQDKAGEVLERIVRENVSNPFNNHDGEQYD